MCKSGWDKSPADVFIAEVEKGFLEQVIPALAIMIWWRIQIIHAMNYCAKPAQLSISIA
jgi:hypothetical protein